MARVRCACYRYETGLTDLITNIAARGPLRIAIPGDEPPYITTVRNGSFVAGTSSRDGSIVRFVTDLFDRHGVPWEEVQITPESRVYSPDSSFTACVHDVALNVTDVCVGSFWAFEFRRRLADFTSSVEMADLYVIAPRKEPVRCRPSPCPSNSSSHPHRLSPLVVPPDAPRAVLIKSITPLALLRALHARRSPTSGR